MYQDPCHIHMTVRSLYASHAIRPCARLRTGRCPLRAGASAGRAHAGEVNVYVALVLQPLSRLDSIAAEDPSQALQQRVTRDTGFLASHEHATDDGPAVAFSSGALSADFVGLGEQPGWVAYETTIESLHAAAGDTDFSTLLVAQY